MSIWGIAASLPNPVIATAGSDVACPAATETTVLSASLSGGQPGQNIAVISDLSCVIVLGATPPTALVIACRLQSGSDYDTYTLSTATLTANAVLNLAPVLAGILARGALQSGATIQLTVNPTGQAVTFKAGGRVVHQFYLSVDV